MCRAWGRRRPAQPFAYSACWSACLPLPASPLPALPGDTPQHLPRVPPPPPLPTPAPPLLPCRSQSGNKHLQKAFSANSPRLIAVAKAESADLMEQLQQVGVGVVGRWDYWWGSRPAREAWFGCLVCSPDGQHGPQRPDAAGGAAWQGCVVHGLLERREACP